MVFGEPDVDIRPAKSGSAKTASDATDQIEVEIRRLDVYDPST